MSRYVGLLGLWLPEPVLPPLDEPFTHSHDLTMASVVALLDGGPPRNELTFDDGPRLVEQQLDGGRIASGWLARGLMLGGERGARWRADGQYHPATAHWLRDDGRVAWLRLRHAAPLDVTAGPNTLAVAVHDHRRGGRRPVVVETSDPATFGPDRWEVAGRPIACNSGPRLTATASSMPAPVTPSRSRSLDLGHHERGDRPGRGPDRPATEGDLRRPRPRRARRGAETRDRVLTVAATDRVVSTGQHEARCSDRGKIRVIEIQRLVETSPPRPARPDHRRFIAHCVGIALLYARST